MNDLSQQQPIVLTGQIWRAREEGPWPSKILVTISEVQDGWVRYGPAPKTDEFQRQVADFTRLYERAEPAVERAEEEKLRQGFERWATRHNWNLERDERYTPWQYRSQQTQYGFGAYLAGARGECL